tara:strand:+ start:120 stop:446 length:327 start_codon:yes stop_codon:yes gene_type:complete
MDKRRYIYNSINSKKLYNTIMLKFINDYSIKYTENANGTFINLSTIDDKYIDILYDIIEKNISITYIDNIIPIIKTESVKVKADIIEYEELEITEDIDLDIINLSKLI